MSEHHPTLAPSSFPALNKCSHFHGENRSTVDNVLGNRLHKVFECLLKGLNFDSSDLSSYDLSGVLWAVEVVHREVSKFLGYEANLPDLFESGELDIEKRVTLRDRDFSVITWGSLDCGFRRLLFDLKTGLEKDYLPQLAVYALAEMIRKCLGKMLIFELYTRTRNAHSYSLTREEAEKIVFGIIGRKGTGRPSPCEFCGFCGKQYSCKELIDSSSQVVSAYSGVRIHSSEVMREVLDLLKKYQDLLNDPEPDEENYKNRETIERQLSGNSSEFKTLWDIAKYSDKFFKSVKNSITQSIKAGLNVKGIELSAKRGAFEIDDIKRVYALSCLGENEFLGISTPSLSKISGLYDVDRVEQVYRFHKIEIPEQLKAKTGKSKGRLKKDRISQALELLFSEYGHRGTSTYQLKFKKQVKEINHVDD